MPVEHVPQFTSAPAEEYRNPLAGMRFRLDGTEFACEGEVTFLDISEIAGLAMSGEDSRSPAGMATISAFFQLVLGPVQYLRFKAHIREHRTDDDTILAIMALVNERVGVWSETETGRPTAPSRPSSPGPTAPDERISKVISLQSGDVTVLQPGDPRIPKTATRRAAGGRKKATAG